MTDKEYPDEPIEHWEEGRGQGTHFDRALMVVVALAALIVFVIFLMRLP